MGSAEQHHHVFPPSVSSQPATKENHTLPGETLTLLFALSQVRQEEDVPFETMLTTVTDGVRQLLQADLCLLFLPERSGALLLHGVSPQHLAPSLPFAPIVLGAEAGELRSQNRPFLLPSPSFTQLNPLTLSPSERDCGTVAGASRTSDAGFALLLFQRCPSSQR